MKVSEAIASRISVREFLDKSVSNDLLSEILEKANRAPSGGNCQPWHVYVLNGEAMTRFQEAMLKDLMNPPADQFVSHNGYPEPLKQPYNDYRFKCAMDMYGALGIDRKDKPARFKQLMRNADFFGAPAAFIIMIDKTMIPVQWHDVGMFTQSCALLFKEAGLDTCAQGFWARPSGSVSKFVGAPEDLQVICGLAIGYRDGEAPVNSLVTDRAPLDDWATFVD